MSHVAVVDLSIDRLDLLDEACAACGLELVRGQTTWKWYGSWQNDYDSGDAAYKNGLEPDLYGRQASHVIRVRGANSETYEIGVYQREKGFRLFYDNWRRGFGLEEKAGKNLAKLKTEYGVRRAALEAKRKGMSVKRTVINGRVALVCQ